MVLSELLNRLRNEAGITSVVSSTIHYAIKNGKVDRPRLNGALSFDFTEANYQQIVNYLAQPRQRGRKSAKAREA